MTAEGASIFRGGGGCGRPTRRTFLGTLATALGAACLPLSVLLRADPGPPRLRGARSNWIIYDDVEDYPVLKSSIVTEMNHLTEEMLNAHLERTVKDIVRMKVDAFFAGPVRRLP